MRHACGPGTGRRRPAGGRTPAVVTGSGTAVCGLPPLAGATHPHVSPYHHEPHRRSTHPQTDTDACTYRWWLPGGMLLQEWYQRLVERLRLLKVRQVGGRWENHQCGAWGLLLDSL